MKRRSLSIPLCALVYFLTVGSALAPARLISDGTSAPPSPKQLPVSGEVDRTGYIKGLYVTYSALGDAGFQERVQQLLVDTELNAVVMDFKGDRGYLSFPTEVPLAQEIGADDALMVRDAESFMSWFQQQGVYTIARIVVFKDTLLSNAYPEWSVTDANTGGVWHDHEGLGWADPSLPAVWSYNVALAVEAARMGFDEVQFDYVRFPTDGNVGGAQFAVASTFENRLAAITGLLEAARDALHPLGVKLGADVFGYTGWVPDDLGIGQHLESIAPYLDVIAPMVYPSTYSAGLPGEGEQYDNAIAYPYEVVHMSTQRTVERVRAVNPKIEVRPWLQDFRDYAFDGRLYTAQEIRLQMDGVRDGGGRGWMLWDPAVQYTREALVSAAPSYSPNPRGRVLVLAYRDFVSTAEAAATAPEGARTLEAFRAELERLFAAGFYPVNVSELAVDKLRSVPAGKRPVALTFDDSTEGQFVLRTGGSPDPGCAVGVLVAMHAAHPVDWPLRATFFVDPVAGQTGDGLFGDAGQAEAKLRMLVDLGMEVAVSAAEQSSLASLSDDELQAALGGPKATVEKLLPGYVVRTVALPGDGMLRNSALLPSGSFEGVAYSYQSAVLSGGGLASSPQTSGFDPYRISRSPASALEAALTEAEMPGQHFVSGGE